MTAAGMHFPYAVGILILRGMNNMDDDPLAGFHRQQGIVVLSCVTRIEKSKPNVLRFSLHYTSSLSSHAILHAALQPHLRRRAILVSALTICDDVLYHLVNVTSRRHICDNATLRGGVS